MRICFGILYLQEYRRDYCILEPLVTEWYNVSHTLTKDFVTWRPFLGPFVGNSFTFQYIQ